MTFWEQATNFTGEMFDLLLFAFVIWSLLEYRLDEREWRLFLAAVVYGAGMADDWALIGFLPVFVGAIIWIRGLSFFNLRFLVPMALCGLAGMLFYLLLPLLAVVSHKMPVTFWQALKLNLSAQWYVVKLFFTRPDVRYTVVLLSLDFAAAGVCDGHPLADVVWRQQQNRRAAGELHVSSGPCGHAFCLRLGRV